MLIGRPKTALALDAEEESELRGFLSSRSLPHAQVARAKLVLWSAKGKSNSEIANHLNWTKATVGEWRQRFVERRLSGIYVAHRPGRPQSVSDEKVALLLRRTLKNKPLAGGHRRVRQAADLNGLLSPPSIESFERLPSDPTIRRTSNYPAIPSLLKRYLM